MGRRAAATVSALWEAWHQAKEHPASIQALPVAWGQDTAGSAGGCVLGGHLVGNIEGTEENYPTLVVGPGDSALGLLSALQPVAQPSLLPHGFPVKWSA